MCTPSLASFHTVVHRTTCVLVSCASLSHCLHSSQEPRARGYAHRLASRLGPRTCRQQLRRYLLEAISGLLCGRSGCPRMYFCRVSPCLEGAPRVGDRGPGCNVIHADLKPENILVATASIIMAVVGASHSVESLCDGSAHSKACRLAQHDRDMKRLSWHLAPELRLAPFEHLACAQPHHSRFDHPDGKSYMPCLVFLCPCSRASSVALSLSSSPAQLCFAAVHITHWSTAVGGGTKHRDRSWKACCSMTAVSVHGPPHHSASEKKPSPCVSSAAPFLQRGAPEWFWRKRSGAPRPRVLLGEAPRRCVCASLGSHMRAYFGRAL